MKFGKGDYFMLKIRAMGTKNDIVWFQKIISRIKKIRIISSSDYLPIVGSKKNYRMYFEIEKSNIKEK